MDIAEKIYCLNPDLMHVLPKRAIFMPYCSISPKEWLPKFTQLKKRPLKIGHAPSNRIAKGTDLILKAVSDLKAEGFNFEFELIENLSNEDARKRYEAIDILIDQLFYGWYGGVAVEAMALGKPVMVYIRSDDLGFIPKMMREEFLFIEVNPKTIKDGLREVLMMSRPELLEIAHRSRGFVERWHDPKVIISQYKADYENALQARKVGAYVWN